MTIKNIEVYSEMNGSYVVDKDKKITGYASIDKPWQKYYSKEAITASIPELTAYQYMVSQNEDNLSTKAIMYYGKKISYKNYIDMIDETARRLYNLGVTEGEVVTVMSVANPELEVSVVDSIFYNFVGIWGGYQKSGVNSIDFLATVSQSRTYREGTMTVQGDRNTYYGSTSNIKKSSAKYIGATLKILGGSELSIPTEEYVNIDNISKSLFTTINGVIFFKETFYDLAIPYYDSRDREVEEY